MKYHVVFQAKMNPGFTMTGDCVIPSKGDRVTVEDLEGWRETLKETYPDIRGYPVILNWQEIYEGA